MRKITAKYWDSGKDSNDGIGEEFEILTNLNDQYRSKNKMLVGIDNTVGESERMVEQLGLFGATIFCFILLCISW